MSIRFIHFRPEELEIAKRFIETIEGYSKIETDVRLYPPEEEKQRIIVNALKEYSRLTGISLETLERTITDDEKRMLIELKAKRIDMVVHWPEEIWIVEIKQKVRASAIGQLKLYELWYRRQFRPTKPIRLVLVAEIDDPMVLPLLKKEGIKKILV